jgi:hypothetical protein
MTSHGGELSDSEYQESRCNYWRKHADDYNLTVIAVAEAAQRERSKIHPDKGRSDEMPWALASCFPE